jgi:hypothetical protein
VKQSAKGAHNSYPISSYVSLAFEDLTPQQEDLLHAVLIQIQQVIAFNSWK